MSTVLAGFARERERERESERGRERERVCVCVCACVREYVCARVCSNTLNAKPDSQLS